ncbi:unnamed protein product [Rodentolepis nana]|uniref:DUF998 domain-containing protein n=1 Tax=Rodentolepis nana TaxID=102285 RepID=A0A0R3THZ5_RODNA|nr:unnamed protein product [Rodentolepis nana]
MKNHIRYLPGLFAIVSFTLLSGVLPFDCGALFSNQCQNSSYNKELTGLISTASLLFSMSLIFCSINIIKVYKILQACEFLTLGSGTVLMVAAVGQIFHGKDMLVAVMATISMAMSCELVIFISFDHLINHFL